jgi:hypothetical protein
MEALEVVPVVVLVEVLQAVRPEVQLVEPSKVPLEVLPEESPEVPRAVWPAVSSVDPDPELAASLVSSAESAVSWVPSITSVVTRTRKTRDSNALRTA